MYIAGVDYHQAVLLCFAPVEDAEHVLKSCPTLSPIPDAWPDMPMTTLLGFSATHSGSFSHLVGVKASLKYW